MIAHYIKRIPDLCQKFKDIVSAKSLVVVIQCLTNTVKELLLDEYEILNWVKFMDRFDFEEASFEVHILYIGLATKLILSTESQKEPFLCLATQKPIFLHFNQWINYNNVRFFTDYQDHIKCHQLFKKLREGLEPPFDYDEYRQRKEREKLMEATDLNEIVDEIMIKDQNSIDSITIGNSLSKWNSLASIKSNQQINQNNILAPETPI